MLTVHYAEKTEIYDANNGETILAALRRASKTAAPGSAASELMSSITALCGGGGRCGKCRVKASGSLSRPDEREEVFIRGASDGVRLACLCRILGDAEVSAATDGKMSIQSAGLMNLREFMPAAFAVTVELACPTIDSVVPDDMLLLAALSGIAGRITPYAQRRLSHVLRDSGYRVQAVCLRGSDGCKVANVREPGVFGLYGIAVDIGTTTVVMYMYDLQNGTPKGVISRENAQRPFGADVISRINYCRSDPGRLTREITSQLSSMAAELCSAAGAGTDEIVSVVITGNTTMEHLAAGFDPEGIANAPFIPSTLFWDARLTAADIGLCVLPDAEVYFVPSLSAYVGGDITAGIAACSLAEREGTYLLLDIGTNGEIVLGGSGHLLTCSAAAGPAFEGAHIACGMPAIPGAINHIWLEENDIKYSVLGDVEPVGICGSAIIDAVAVLLEIGAIDETGRLSDEDIKPEFAIKIRECGDTDAFYFTENVYISGRDVREVQLAKAAIAAGIKTLEHELGIDDSDVSQVYIAGGFGSYINVDSACRIGLLPRVLRDRTQAVGNTAGTGAVAALLSVQERQRHEKIRSAAEYIELSASAFFNDVYIEQMCFE